MSVTQDYKTVTLSLRELIAVEFSLECRLAYLRARTAAGDTCAAELVEQYESALAKVEAAL